MKTVSQLKTNSNVESPKTPGGISKSLLTPCRRLGLSRNFRKSGKSPFISPLSGSADVKQEVADTTRKRKLRCDENPSVKEQNEYLTCTETEEKTQDSRTDKEAADECNDIDTTPSRVITLPQRKKSKTLITSKIEKSITESPKTPLNTKAKVNEEVIQEEISEARVNAEEIQEKISDEANVVSTPVRTKSKTRSKKLIVESATEVALKNDDVKENDEIIKLNSNQTGYKPKSPENLTKECIVVIQKKIFKKDLKKTKNSNNKIKEANPVSQALFDSDSDDTPLSVLNKNEKLPKVEQPVIILDDDNDFAEKTNVKVKKLEDKTTSTGGLQSKNVKKKSSKMIESVKKPKTKAVCVDSKPASQCSFDDDDDFVMDRKTILIRKTYDKVSKPLKAKSTGSITQNDIDELKARIEMKKKLLLAKAMTKDTEELRTLIKKWQKGCQDALMELMDLMKYKFPDKKNMDYSEILKTLKIPASMVGYDEENDDFITPTDENIILSRFNDL